MNKAISCYFFNTNHLHKLRLVVVNFTIDHMPFYRTTTPTRLHTFYKTTTGEKGLSSGSLVINCHGQAVRINVGGKTYTSFVFYLPLDRVVRELKFFTKVK
jgi:hypothetical protein